MDIFKSIRIRRIEKARKIQEEKIKEEQEKIAEAERRKEEEEKGKKSQQRLEDVLLKVLTISAREYCEIYEKDITDYEVRGVHIIEDSYYIGDFVKKIPSQAEVVVGFQQTTGGEYRKYMASGTALIPKKKK